jgi:hypothetical protein
VSEVRRHWVAEVLNRRPAQFDAPTRAAVRDLLFGEWLAVRRAEATVRWHWM